MYNFKKSELKNSSDIQIGYIYKLSGEIIHGINEEKIKELEGIIEEFTEDSENQIIIFDLTDLKKWDSLGVTSLVGKTLEINENLKKDRGVLISFVGNKDMDIYRAVTDKYTAIVVQDSLPWFNSVKDFLKNLE